jgi:MerR family redox-sensitive transcriptional activator SoxR
MKSLSIGEVADQVGIAASAIRYYESVGLLPRAERHNGRRVYDGSVLERLTIIHLAKGAGFTVAEIKHLLRGFERRTPPGERWRTLADHKLIELDERIAQAERMKNVLRMVMACECPTFSDCSQAIGRGEEPGAPAR